MELQLYTIFQQSTVGYASVPKAEEEPVGEETSV